MCSLHLMWLAEWQPSAITTLIGIEQEKIRSCASLDGGLKMSVLDTLGSMEINIENMKSTDCKICKLQKVSV